MNILNDFNINVVIQHPIYNVIYIKDNYSGTCTYREIPPQSKFQTNKIFLLTHSNMGEVIEYINQISPLSPNDLNNVQMNIREHSLNQLLMDPKTYPHHDQ